MSGIILLKITNKKKTFVLRMWAPMINLPISSPSHLMRRDFASSGMN
jgi:hypothetical protein